jgi:multidrug efflux pump subunit AcrB
MLVTNFSIKFRNAVLVFIFVLAIAGISTYINMPREGSPDITVPYITVASVFPGAAPEEVENLVTIPLEKEFASLDNMEEIESQSMENVSVITMKFAQGQNIDMAIQRIKDRVDQIRIDLPDDLEEPTVTDFNISTDLPVFGFSIYGDDSLERLNNIAENIKDEIENISGVLTVEILGIQERELRVSVDLARLYMFDLNLDAINGALMSENLTVSAGHLKSDKNFQLRVPGEFKTVSGIKDIPIYSINGKKVNLSDVATVEDSYKDLSTTSRVNGDKCISVTVTKRAGKNSLNMIDELNEYLEDYDYPNGINYMVTLDQSTDIRNMLFELENSVATGFLLVVGVLLIFMGIRNSFLVGVAIPLSMLISFIVLDALGITLNGMVLFSLVLALGMLVDNAIVIVENIFRHHCEGKSKIQSALLGASEVAWPVVTSTLTTLAAFSPLLFWPDIMGEFMSYLPKTLICVLTASLFVAIVINPAVCSFVIAKPKAKKQIQEKEPGRFVRLYIGLLKVALAHKVVVMVLTTLFLIFTIACFGKFNKGVELFPDTDPRFIDISIKFPEGTKLLETDDALKQIEQQLETYENIDYYVANAGYAGGGISGGASGTYVGMITVTFKEFGDRVESSWVTLDNIRNELPIIPGAEIKVDKQTEGPPRESPISIEISGDDFDVLQNLAYEIRQIIKDVPGLVDLQDDFESARPELQFRVDRDKASLLGLSTASIGMALRTSFYGTETTKFRVGDEQYDITVRLPDDMRGSTGLLDEIFITNQQGGAIPLTSVGELVYAAGKGKITRKERRRTITITGNNQARGVDKILVEIQNKLKDLNIPQGCSIKFAGDNEDINEAGSFLGKAFFIALGAILVILVIQFNSILIPFVILVTVLLSMIGVMWGLLICQFKFGVIMTGVGVISLAGIVVNNAIVLIDCIQQQRNKHSMDRVTAVITAGRLRLRPVLLTATTTILGMIPLAIGYSLDFHSKIPTIIKGSEQSQWWAPMAVAVIFGLAVSTVLTLVIIPVMYCITDSFAEKFVKFFKIEKH